MTAIPAPGNYCYAVSAIDEAGNESEQSRSTCVDVPPPPDTEPPSVPSGVSASVTESGVKIIWSASADNKAVAGYRVFRNGVKISEVTETSLSDSSVSPGTRCCYTVSAFDASGNESAKSVESCVDSPAARDIQPPSVPSGLSSSRSSGTVLLSWSASTDNIAVSGYKIYRNGSYLASVTSTSYSDSGIFGSGQNCYTILAFDAAGNESQLSDQSCTYGDTGKTRWKLEINDQIDPQMVLSSDGTLYLITSKPELYAIGADGNIKWKYVHEGEYTPNSKYLPVIGSDGTVYWGVDRYFYAIKADGGLKWKAEINGSSSDNTRPGSNTTPAVHADGTFFVNDRSFSYIISSEGVLKKKTVHNYVNFRLPSPVIGHDGTIYGVGWCLYPDGSEKIRSCGNVGLSVAFNHDGPIDLISKSGAFSGIYQTGLVSMNSDYSEKWRIDIDGIRFDFPAVGADGTVYAASSDGYLNAISTSGIVKWKKSVGQQMADNYNRQDLNIPAVGSDGTVYIQTDTGLHALDGNGGELWVNQEATGSSCPLIGSDGTIFASSGNAVYAVYSNSHGLASSPWPRHRKNNENTGNSIKAIPDAPPPPSPSGVTASAQSPSMIKLDWLASTGGINSIKGYKIYRNGQNIDFTFEKEYVDLGLSSSTSYCYRIAAVDFAGKESVGTDVCASTPSEALEGQLKWKFKYNYLDGYIIHDSPPVLLADGSFFAAGKYCIDPAKGTLRWTIPNDAMIRYPSVARDSSVYDRPYFCANADGSIRWQKVTPMSAGFDPAAIDGTGNLFVGYTNGLMRAFDSLGTEKWVFSTGTGEVMNMPSIASDSTLYTTSFDGVLYAVKSDGILKWKFDASRFVDSGERSCTRSASIGDDGTVYFAVNFVSASSSGGVLFAIKPDGTKKWEFRTSADGQDISLESPVVDPEGIVYIGGDSLRAIKNDGTLKWERNVFASTPVIGKDGILYIFSNSGLEAINPDGSLKWLYPSSYPYIDKCVIGDDGTLYFDTGYELCAVQTSSMGLAPGGWPKIYHDNQNTGCATNSTGNERKR